MRGQILGYDENARSGVISGDSGDRVPFTIAEWKSTDLPKPGMKVDFDLVEGSASQIYAVPGSTNPLDAIGGDQPPEKQALTYGIISLVSAVLTYVLGPLGLITLVIALIFGFKGKKIGANLADKTGYYLSIAGIIISLIGFIVLFLALAACGTMIGGLGAIGAMSHGY